MQERKYVTETSYYLNVAHSAKLLNVSGLETGHLEHKVHYEFRDSPKHDLLKQGIMLCKVTDDWLYDTTIRYEAYLLSIPNNQSIIQGKILSYEVLEDPQQLLKLLEIGCQRLPLLDFFDTMDQAWDLLDTLAFTTNMVNTFNLGSEDSDVCRLRLQEWSTCLKVKIMHSPETDLHFKIGRISTTAHNCDHLPALRDHIANILQINDLGRQTSHWLFIILRNVGLLHELPMLT